MLMLFCYVGEDAFAVDSEQIEEIIPRVHLQPLPLLQNSIAGLLNFGGILVPVVDLSSLIAGRASSFAMHTRIILFNNPNGKASSYLGMIAEKVIEYGNVDEKNIVNAGVYIDALPFLAGRIINKRGPGHMQPQIIDLHKFFAYFDKLVNQFHSNQ